MVTGFDILKALWFNALCRGNKAQPTGENKMSASKNIQQNDDQAVAAAFDWVEDRFAGKSADYRKNAFYQQVMADISFGRASKAAFELAFEIAQNAY